ncbi:hypothetical protein CRENBAI_023380 [Crenichthys baileyi]|uniref:Uncharacterized protein n=1 Tax=Crenichthys baileyi TaxID=28760 RepID=A0AAV9RWB4_9TELE
MAVSDGFPASFYGEPGVLGLLSNGISAFLVLLQNFNTAHNGKAPVGVENILAGVHLILIGGLCQLVAGLLSFRKYDHLSGTAFIGYAALWGSYGATRIYYGALSENPNMKSQQLLAWSPTFSCPSYLRFALPRSTTSCLLCLESYHGHLIFEAVALAADLLGSGGSVGLEFAHFDLCHLWFSRSLLKGLDSASSLERFWYPNSLMVLLLGTPNSVGQPQVEAREKKNTKYAEPMALGFFW